MVMWLYCSTRWSAGRRMLAKHTDYCTLPSPITWVFRPTREKHSHSTLSSVLAHNEKTGHEVSFEDFQMLSSESTQFNVLLQKSLLISKIKFPLTPTLVHIPWNFFNITFFSLFLYQCYYALFITFTLFFVLPLFAFTQTINYSIDTSSLLLCNS